MNDKNKNLKLYQKEANCNYYTEQPIYDSLNGKQISSGYEIKTENDKSVGIFSFENFVKMAKVTLIDNENILVRHIESKAPFTKKSKKKERGRMTLRLRFEVMKRDKFRCSICGARAGDIELEIDHIIPVSKGGKTEINNLQTLCFDCNRGKSSDL